MTLNAYYFIHKGYNLAPVYAHTEQEARTILLTQHVWCDAPYNAPLKSVAIGTEWERICAA
jgi:hypothetical protein